VAVGNLGSGDNSARRGSKILKHAQFLREDAALIDSLSRTYTTSNVLSIRNTTEH